MLYYIAIAVGLSLSYREDHALKEQRILLTVEGGGVAAATRSRARPHSAAAKRRSALYYTTPFSRYAIPSTSQLARHKSGAVLCVLGQHVEQSCPYLPMASLAVLPDEAGYQTDDCVGASIATWLQPCCVAAWI